eukprot:maker-scaffold_30-snap-gene-3.26-mRNA-1 protein AED:0.01 eAED:0.01 QI:64/1/1/1/1/1/3/362/616
MSTIHESLKGSNVSVRKIKRALISVSDKTGIVDFGKLLESKGVDIISTGGTCKVLKEAGVKVVDVSSVTDFPEILNGRVKTLHPKIHGGILSVRGNELHETQMEQHGINPIDLVVLNLYPFEETVASGKEFDTCVENIDIGGPAMLRASAKNFSSVVVLTSPMQYEEFFHQTETELSTTYEQRKEYAAKAFQLSAQYDAAISSFFADTNQVVRKYKPEAQLKYGCNPNQTPANLLSIGSSGLPFKVLNGSPGYINYLDALNSWQLVKELSKAMNLPAVASFKHVSPAGCAVYAPLSPEEVAAFDLGSKFVPEECSNLELAYIRARQTDPMSSFGDFIAISEVVDVRTAKRIKSDISDGLIAPGFEPEALEILAKKKGGKFIVLEMNKAIEPDAIEYREVHGVVLSQSRNLLNIAEGVKSENVVTKNKGLDEAARRDLIVGNIALKYTQSNSVAFAKNGQVVGVGAGQQSRVDCVKLAGKKSMIYFLRQNPEIAGLKFVSGVKRQDRINARVALIECILNKELDHVSLNQLTPLFESNIEDVFNKVSKSWLNSVAGVSLVSDAFFPFRDNIDVCSNLGFKVKYVAQAGGSVKDPSVIEACDENEMVMVLTGQRLFHH